MDKRAVWAIVSFSLIIAAGVVGWNITGPRIIEGTVLGGSKFGLIIVSMAHVITVTFVKAWLDSFVLKV